MENLKLKDFLDFAFLSNVEISPNGKYAAFVRSVQNYDENKYISDIWILNTLTKKYFKLTSAGDLKSFIWINDSVGIFKSCLRDENLKKKVEEGEIWSSYYAINVEGGEASKYMDIALDINDIIKIDEDNFLVSAVFDNYRTVLNGLKGEERKNTIEKIKENKDYEVLDEIPFWSNADGFTNKKRNRLYLYNRKNNEIIPVTDEYTDVGYFTYKEGKVLYTSCRFTNKKASTDGIYLYNINNCKTSAIIEEGKYKIGFAEFFNEKIICALSDMKKYGHNENGSFYIIENYEQNKNLKLLKEYDNAIYNSVSSDCVYGGGKIYRVFEDKLYFIGTEGYNSYIYTIDLSGNIKRLTKDNGNIITYAVGKEEIFFIGLRGLRLEEIYCQKISSGDAESQVTSFNEVFFKEKKLSSPKHITFKSDNADIDGWVITPVDFDKNKKYPAILDIHGGPKMAYGSVFFNEMQVWANMGYFVFFCNPRGSEGKGNSFADIRGKYGTVDYDDIMRFVAKVLEDNPQIDDGRLGVTGGSYGGFMVNWIIGHTDRFKCAASQRSVANWVGDFGITDIGYEFNPDELLGDPWEGHDNLWRQSPLKYANKAKTPTLFVHSNEDYRCSIGEAYQMFTALKYHGVEARMCMFKGENHELSRSGKPKHRVRRLEEITNWFEKYLKD